MKKLAIITGTSRGIGREIASKMIEKNYLVYGYSRNNTLTHKKYTFINQDLSELDQVRKIKFPEIKNLEEAILINNAANIGTILPLREKLPKDIISEYNLNLITPVLLSNNFINTYSNINKKAIINISSGASTKPIHSWSTYCSSKSGLDAFTNVLSEEGCQTLSIYPGVVDTKMQEKIRESSDDKFPLLEKFLDYHTNKDLLSPEYVASKIVKIIQNLNQITSKIIDIRSVE